MVAALPLQAASRLSGRLAGLGGVPPAGGVRKTARIMPRVLELDIELASPPDFIPELPGWRERSPCVLREGSLSVHHFDFYSQALSKIERGFDSDLADVGVMIAGDLVDPARLRQLYEAIELQPYRYPAIDPSAFRRKLDDVLGAS